LLLPLEDYIGSDGIDLVNVAESVLQGGKIDGKLSEIPLGTNLQAFILAERLNTITQFCEHGEGAGSVMWD
jgi:hypothetical protein